MPFIEIKNLNKTFPVGKLKFQALKDICLTVGRGETVAIMGRSGSGKTTLLNIIGTLDTFDSGDYAYDGRSVAKMNDAARSALRAEDIGFVQQDFLLLNRKTAAENVAAPLLFGKTPYREIPQLVYKALSDAGVPEQADKKITDMSGGQKQRVAIARAIVTSPSLILADEPTGALDRATSVEIMELMLRLNRERGITLIIVTHDSEIASMCGRVLHISDGALED